LSFAPLLQAAPIVQVHAFAAMAAFALGLVQLLAPKGTVPHRALGWVWVILMLAISLSSFWIYNRTWSWIHLLSVGTPIMLAAGIVAARRNRIRRHKIVMTTIFIGALVIAGFFTFMPGRVMHHVLFG
jgi:uncharacterized membrane protein